MRNDQIGRLPRSGQVLHGRDRQRDAVCEMLRPHTFRRRAEHRPGEIDAKDPATHPRERDQVSACTAADINHAERSG